MANVSLVVLNYVLSCYMLLIGLYTPQSYMWDYNFAPMGPCEFKITLAMSATLDALWYIVEVIMVFWH